MTSKTEPGSKRRGRLAGWVLVVLGVLTIVQGSVISVYPSLTPETWRTATIWFVASMTVGALLIILGAWVLLGKK